MTKDNNNFLCLIINVYGQRMTLEYMSIHWNWMSVCIVFIYTDVFIGLIGAHSSAAQWKVMRE